MHALFTRLHRDHQNLDKVLRLLECQFDACAEGEDPDFETIVDVLEYLAEYADQVHHPLEERMFEQVLERDDELGELTRRAHHQHADLSRVTREFQSAVDGVAHGEVMARDELEVRARSFLALQREHLDLEEGRLFPLLREALDGSFLDEVAEAIPAADDPLFGSVRRAEFQRLFEALESL